MNNSRYLSLLLLGVLLCLFANHNHANSWAFNDTISNPTSPSLIDLSWLNEDKAGQDGWVQTSSDGNSFIKGDGKAIRFWAVGTSVAKKDPTNLSSHARFLARRGVNMVRWHENIISSSADLYAIDEKALDELFLLVAAMKEEGIYTTISPYYAHSIKRQGYGKHINSSWGLPRNPNAKNMSGLLFFDPILQQAYKEWIKQLFNRVNPYTGLALKDDPAVALFQIQNEDSLFFWTFNHIKGKDLGILEEQYTHWLLKKYGSFDRIKEHWKRVKPRGRSDSDNWSTGPLLLSPISSLVRSNINSKHRNRLRDQTEFLSETMRSWNLEITNFLRDEIGTKLLINAGNWKTASPELLNDLERYTYTTSDVIAVNRYVHGIHKGKKSGWAILNGQKFDDFSVLKNPDKLPIALKQIDGFPTVVTETAWVAPLSYQAEGAFLTSVMQSLNGIDSVYWFNADTARWKQPGSANGFLPSLSKWSIQTPMAIGQFPAAALNFRMKLLDETDVVFHEKRSLDSLYHRLPSAINEQMSYDPNRDQNQISSQQQQDSEQFTRGAIKISYLTDKNMTPNSEGGQEHFRGQSNLKNQVTWDSKKGVIVVNAPASQGVCGFSKGRKIKTEDIIFSNQNDYACLWMVSMTDQSIRESSKVLLQIGTRQFPKNWRTQQETIKHKKRIINGYRIVSYGEAPWKIENLRSQIELLHSPFLRAQSITENGLHKEDLQLKDTEQGQSLTLPTDALYVLLTR